MVAAERLQRSFSDSFWGIDLENQNMVMNLDAMQKEDGLSTDYELFRKTQLVHQQWEAEHQELSRNRAVEDAMVDLSARRAYINALFDAQSSEEIFHYKWNSSESENVYHRHSNMHLRDPSLVIHDQNTANSNSLFHLEGLQQARALDNQNFGGPGGNSSTSKIQTLGPLIRGRAITPGLANGMMSSQLDGKETQSNIEPKEQSQSVEKIQHTQSGSVEDKQGSFLGFFDEKSSVEMLEGEGSFSNITKKKPVKKEITQSEKRNSQSFNGHPYFKWDQELILREVFDLLDTKHAGVLYPNDISKIASSVELQYLLSFTVYAAWIKKKKWKTLLLALYGSEEVYQSNSQAITLVHMFDVAGDLSFETNKPIKHIRTEAEHLELLTHDSNFYSLEGNSVTFAEHARLHRDKAVCELYRGYVVCLGGYSYVTCSIFVIFRIEWFITKPKSCSIIP